MSEIVYAPSPEPGWPRCPTADCPNLVCMWGGEGLCHPCSIWLVGRGELDRRYRATRVSETDLRWNGELAP